MRDFTCRGCGEQGSVSTIRCPVPHYHERCAPTKQARHVARQREVREEVEHLRAEIASMRAHGGVTITERRLLALTGDLLGQWAAYSGGTEPPTDEALADLLIDAVRAGVSARSRRHLLAVAGACLARALVVHETLSERNAVAASGR